MDEDVRNGTRLAVRTICHRQRVLMTIRLINHCHILQHRRQLPVELDELVY